MNIFANIINTIVYILGKVISFNDVFCTFIILLAIISFRKLHKNVERNIKDIENFINKSEEIEGDLSSRINIVKKENFFNGNEFLIKEWDKYVSYARNNKISDKIPGISEHFSRFNIIDIPGKRKIAELIPGTLTALGILGTFLGLQGGVSNIDVETTERLKDSIVLLTSGMSLAFITSIVGIIASMLWSYFDRKKYKYYLQVLDQFYNVFNIKYPVYNSTSFYAEILELQKESTNSVKQLATDLSLEFSKVLTNSINQIMLPGIDETLNKIVKQDIKPNIEVMTDMIDNFTVNASDKQAVALNTMVDDFINKLNGSVQFQFDELGKTIHDFTQWHKETKSSLEELVQEIKEGALNQQEVNANAEEIITKFTSLFDGFNLINTQIAEVIGKIEGVINKLNSITENNIEILENLNNIHENINESYEYTKNSLSELMENIDNAMNSLKSVKEEFENSSKIFTQNLGEGLNATFNIFDDSLSQISQRLSGTILEVQQTVDDLPSAISVLIEELNKNANKLSTAIDEINGIYKDINNLILRENRKEVVS